MFPRNYFTPNYFAPEYFAVGGVIPPPPVPASTGGGGNRIPFHEAPKTSVSVVVGVRRLEVEWEGSDRSHPSPVQPERKPLSYPKVPYRKSPPRPIPIEVPEPQFAEVVDETPVDDFADEVNILVAKPHRIPRDLIRKARSFIQGKRAEQREARDRNELMELLEVLDMMN